MNTKKRYGRDPKCIKVSCNVSPFMLENFSVWVSLFWFLKNEIIQVIGIEQTGLKFNADDFEILMLLENELKSFQQEQRRLRNG